MIRTLVSIAIGCAITSAAIRALNLSGDDAINTGFALAAGFAVLAFIAQLIAESRKRHS